MNKAKKFEELVGIIGDTRHIHQQDNAQWDGLIREQRGIIDHFSSVKYSTIGI